MAFCSHVVKCQISAEIFASAYLSIWAIGLSRSALAFVAYLAFLCRGYSAMTKERAECLWLEIFWWYDNSFFDKSSLDVCGKKKKKEKQNLRFISLWVGVSGLEPEKAGPESAVLPLHHTPILNFCGQPNHERFCSCLMLGYPDSNQERQDQNLQCYHYTIPQLSELY